MVKASAESLLVVINDILDFSKIEAGKLTLDIVDVDLPALIALTLKPLQVRAGQKGLTLGISMAPDLPQWVRGDAVRLRQVLTNLVGNAIKFSSQGVIKVSVCPATDHHDMLQFSVSDTGIGIPKEKQNEIFKPFTQADNSISRQFGGTGLGLTITRHLVSLMDGEIWVDSQVGKGTTFYFSAILPQTSASEHKEAAISHSQPDHALDILLAEDNQDNLLLMTVIFKKTTHYLDIAEDGLIAVEKFRKNHYDVILMDVQMPNMDGYAATAEIRRIEKEEGRTPTRIYALTAHALKEDEQHSLDAGCNGHLTKPINKKVLLETLNSI